MKLLVKNFSKFFVLIFAPILSAIFLTIPAKAQTFLPEPIRTFIYLADPDDEASVSNIRLLILLLFAVIVLIAIYFAVQAAWKYVRSEGDQDKIEASTKAIQTIFLGLGATVAGIVGVVLIFIFFSQDVLGSVEFATCKNHPTSLGCGACQASDGGLRPDWNTIKGAAINPELLAGRRASIGESYGVGKELSNQQICTFCEYEQNYLKNKEVYQNSKEATYLCN